MLQSWLYAVVLVCLSRLVSDKWTVIVARKLET